MTIDSSNRAVVDHLDRNGFPPNALTVETTPGDRWVVTTVSNARRDTTWHQQTAEGLRDALRALPGHPSVRLSAIRDRITVIWDGA